MEAHEVSIAAIEATLVESPLVETTAEAVTVAEIADEAVVLPAPEQAESSLVAELLSATDDRRRQWAQRIREEQRLPGSLRDRLAAVVSEAADLSGEGEPRLTVSQVANVFAEAVPALLVLDTPRLAAHPAGEAFFHAGQLSDNDAASIAREQLRRTGFAG